MTGVPLCITPSRIVLGQSRSRWIDDHDMQELNLHFSKIDLFTTSNAVNSLDQILLNYDGKTESGGAAYSTPTFRRLCREITPRLFGLVFDVATGAAGNRDRAAFSIDHPTHHSEAAIDIFNRCVREYFDRIEGMFLMVNEPAFRAEGLVRKDSLCFPLGPILEVICSMAVSYGWGLSYIFVEDRFFRAMLQSDEFVETMDGDKLYSGAVIDINPYWKSATVSGHRSVTRASDGVYAFRAVPSPSIRSFDSVKSITSMMAKILSPSSSEFFFQSIYDNASVPASSNLNLSVEDTSSLYSDRSLQVVVSWMCRQGIQRRHAVEIAKNVIVWSGSRAAPLDEVFVTMEDISGRTWYDLAINMMRYADGRMGSQSDIIRGCACSILQNRVIDMR